MTGKFQHVSKNVKPAETQVLACPHCTSSLSIRAQGYSVTIVCNACGAIIDLSDKDPIVTAILEKPISQNQYLPLGARGKLHGTLWEVIGFLERYNVATQESWQEYLLFNPYKGFRWLTEWQGHWNYAYSLHEIPIATETVSATYLNREYSYLTAYTALTTFVAGEFYWRVKAGDSARILEYVNTPEILNQEHAGEDIIWSLAEYIDHKSIINAFKSSIEYFPHQIGIAVNQPSPTGHYVAPLLKICGLGVLALFVSSIIFVGLSSRTKILETQFIMPKPNAMQRNDEFEVVSPSFTINTKRGVLSLRVEAPLNNEWLELETDLVNEATGETISLATGIEYYWGYDYEDSMNWVEGSQTETTTLSAPTPGQYHLDIHGKSNSVSNLPVKISLTEGVHPGANFFLAFMLIIAVPCLVLLYELFFSMRKSSSSDGSSWTDWFDDD